jgi:hypothetical protein
VSTATVARTLSAAARKQAPGIHVIESEQIA